MSVREIPAGDIWTAAGSFLLPDGKMELRLVIAANEDEAVGKLMCGLPDGVHVLAKLTQAAIFKEVIVQ